MDPVLSVLIPSYRKGAVIGHCLEQLKTTLKDIRFEIIIVIDGDEDETESRLEPYSSQFLILTLPENMGKGFALKKGFEFASGDFVCFFDADLDIDPTVLITQFNILKEDNAIAGVIANKYHRDAKLDYPLQRRVLSLGLFFLQRILFGLPFRDTQTGAKMFRRSAICEIFSELRTKGFLFDIELLYKLKSKKSQVTDCAVEISHFGDSTIKLRSIFLLLFALIYLRINLAAGSPRIVNFFQRYSN